MGRLPGRVGGYPFSVSWGLWCFLDEVKRRRGGMSPGKGRGNSCVLFQGRVVGGVGKGSDRNGRRCQLNDLFLVQVNDLQKLETKHPSGMWC